MQPYVNILSRVGRFWAGLPPDTVTYLLAVLNNPQGMAAAVSFALQTFGGELLKLYVVAIVVWYIWPRLPTELQHAILKVLRYFWPGPLPGDRDPEGAEERRPEK